MSKKALKVLWWTLALFCLTFSLFAFLRARGLDTTGDPFGILALKPSGVPALALPVQLILLSVVLWLTQLWREATPEATDWAMRVPVAYFDPAEIETKQVGGKVFQGAAIALFLLVPFLLLLLMCIQYLMATIYFSLTRGPTVSLNLNGWQHFATHTIYAQVKGQEGFFVLGYEHGPQYYPLLTWVYAVGVIALAVYFIWSLRSTFRESPSAGS